MLNLHVIPANIDRFECQTISTWPYVLKVVTSQVTWQAKSLKLRYLSHHNQSCITLNIFLEMCFHLDLIEMFDCETSIERVSHKARLNINLLCCAISSKTCPSCGLKSQKIPIWTRERGGNVEVYVESRVESLIITPPPLDNCDNV